MLFKCAHLNCAARVHGPCTVQDARAGTPSFFQTLPNNKESCSGEHADGPPPAYLI